MRDMVRQSLRFLTVGLEMGLSLAVGVLGGQYLDTRFHTAPVLFWIGFALGLGAAVKAVADAVRRARKEMSDD